MRRLAVCLLVASLLFAGCTSPSDPPGDDEEPVPTFAFRISRADVDGDGLSDTLNVTLVGSSETLHRDRLGVLVDGERLDLEDVLSGDTWAPGRSLMIPCASGVHEYQILVDDEVRKVHVTECGVAVPERPPFFQSRVLDGDADGRTDAIELTLLEGGPVAVGELNASMGAQPLRIYANPLTSTLARGNLDNGTQVYTPCVPDARTLNLTWRTTPLPPMAARTCEVFVKGIDAPIERRSLDADDDGGQDGWLLELGNATDGPFARSQISGEWGNRSAVLNGSTALDPPPDAWRSGGTLVSVCPENGSLRFSLMIRGHTVLRTFTSCETAPGQPLLELDLESGGETLEATLAFSRVGTIELERLTMQNGTIGSNGTWTPGGTIELPCPGDQLTLLYEGRLAFRGTSPC